MSAASGYVTIKVLFFAKAREVLGKKESFVDVPEKTSGKELLSFLIKEYQLEDLKCNLILALNENWIDLDDILYLKTGDELAVVPPLSGVTAPEYGAVSLFVGTTRNTFEERPVLKLEYEAYETMAIKMLEKICENIREKFEVGKIAIIHRVGDVPIGEASVVIAISSSHRKPALEAVPFAINALKSDVPIWKKEVYGDGKTSEWKENSESENLMPPDSSVCVQLYEEVIEANPGNEVPSHMIQINADLQEINRRINSFITRKREQVNLSNINDFCLVKSEDSEEGTCARVSAVLTRRKDSKSHLRVHKVENIVGPQTHGFDPGSFTPFRELQYSAPNCPPGAEERLANVERYLNVNVSSRDVFSRLKAIEDKIMFLESVSPEYFYLDGDAKTKHPLVNTILKRTYSLTELDIKMQQLEAKLHNKSKNNV